MSSKEIIVMDVIKGSIAEEAGIEKGDVILSINGNNIEDTIEYKFLISDENIEVAVKKCNGEEWEIEIEKDFYDDLGIIFEDPSLGNPRRCHNKCMFCFIDQLPPDMRESLYFKDDDSRLSFLHGNFITLTNITDEEISRIIRYRISPINISVHTTKPELRVKMLNNKNAGKVLDLIKRLTEGGISINSQIVLCPGINDGEELEKTLNDLYGFYPGIENTAIVPVGITRYRENLTELAGFNKESSKKVIDQVEKLQIKFEKEVGQPFARLADEFYILADMELPPYEHYEDFEQLEDGIGMIRYIENRVREDLKDAKFSGEGETFGIITGVSSYNFMVHICDEIGKKLGIKINVYSVINEFFGERITVSGLITAGDIFKQLGGKKIESTVFIPSCMLKADEDKFLDDITLEELGKKLDAKIVKCRYTGDDFIEKITDEVIRCQRA